MKLRCDENELKGKSFEEAREYTYSVNIPIDIELFILLYKICPHQRVSDTLDEFLTRYFLFGDYPM